MKFFTDCMPHYIVKTPVLQYLTLFNAIVAGDQFREVGFWLRRETCSAHALFYRQPSSGSLTFPCHHLRKLGTADSSSRTALSSTPLRRFTVSSCFRRFELIPFTAATWSPAHRASQRCATLPGRKLLMLGHRPLSPPPDGNKSQTPPLFNWQQEPE
jgi:hypothetical protein